MAPKFCYCFKFKTCVKLSSFGETDYSIIFQPNNVEDFVGVVGLDTTLKLATKHTMGFIPILLLTAIRSMQKPIWLVVVLNQNRNSPMNVKISLRGVTQ